MRHNPAPVFACRLPAFWTNSKPPASWCKPLRALPTPAADVLDKADQMCNTIQRRQQADGSLKRLTTLVQASEASDHDDAAHARAGEALNALMQSQQQRPAPWKLEVVRKALPYYQASWRAKKNLVMVPAHTAAYTEAYLATTDKAFADFVFEMNDWLCGFQVQQPDQRHTHWDGGFMACVDGKPMPTQPTVVSAAYAESLAEAARAARQAGDVARWERYQAAVQRCSRFLMTLQYSEANSQHFTDWYRPIILGGFHASQSDGNIRLETTQQPVCAMIAYLRYVAKPP